MNYCPLCGTTRTHWQGCTPETRRRSWIAKNGHPMNVATLDLMIRDITTQGQPETLLSNLDEITAAITHPPTPTNRIGELVTPPDGWTPNLGE